MGGRLRVVKPPQYVVTSVDTSLQVLQVLLVMQDQGSVGVSEVAARVGVAPKHRAQDPLHAGLSRLC